MLEERGCDRPRTPPPKSPRQIPTPQTPERIEFRRLLDDKTEDVDSTDWSSMTPDHVAKLSEGDLRIKFGAALRCIWKLERTNKALQAQASHYKFNYQMVASEQEERLIRNEVEHQLSLSNQDILHSRLNKSAEAQQTFRSRHLKAKRRVAELAEDTKRQRLSIDHLSRALSTKLESSEPTTTTSRTGSRAQRGSGLEVLSNAAGLAQMQEFDYNKTPHSSPRPDASLLLSPVAFRPNTGRQQQLLPETGHQDFGRTAQSDDEDSFDDSEGTQPQSKLQMGRRLTFNSSGTSQMHARTAPLTPRSPHRPKLAPSALT